MKIAYMRYHRSYLAGEWFLREQLRKCTYGYNPADLFEVLDSLSTLEWGLFEYCLLEDRIPPNVITSEN